MDLNYQKFYLLFFWSIICSSSAQYLNSRWPKYSLSNLPKTSFTCRDKILGGYYADAETQCQMFHVCVKVAGVGVQDFRFLCPNGTAFDQEAQTCADWGDVDCEQATLYYGSDNFDLYRIGSGFESKRAPFADEEEATFHLQRAETADSRRSKQTVVNQSTAPDKISQYNKHSQASNFNLNQYQPSTVGQYQPQSQRQTTVAKPVTNFVNNYQTKPVTVEEKISTTTYRNPLKEDIYSSSNQDNSKDFDEIFKGSHSSNFYNNRNNGKEDDFEDFKPQHKSTTTKPIATSTTRVASSTSTNRPAHIRGRQRGRVQYNNANQISSNRKIKSTTSTTKKNEQFTSARSTIQQTTQSPSTQNRNSYNTAVPQQNPSVHQNFNKDRSTISPITNLQKVVPTTRAYNVLERTQQNVNVQKQQPQQNPSFVQKQPQNSQIINQPFVQTQNNQTISRNQQYYDNFENKSPQPFKIHEYQPTIRPSTSTSTTTSTTTNAPKLQRPLQDPFKVTYNVQALPNDNINRQYQPTIQPTTVATTKLSVNPPTFKLKPQEPKVNQQQKPLNGNGPLIGNQFNQDQVKPITTQQPKYSNNYQQQINFGKSDYTVNKNEFSNQFNKYNDFYQSTKSVAAITSQSAIQPTERSSINSGRNGNNFYQQSNQFSNEKQSLTPQINSEQQLQQNRGNNYQQKGNQNRDFSRQSQQQQQNVDSFNRAIGNYQNNQQRADTKQFVNEPVPTTFNPTIRFKSSNSPTSEFESSSPRGFAQQQTPIGSNARQQTTQNRINNENYTPSSVKRFSTLVPRELYDPTTFKPTTYQKSYEQYRREEQSLLNGRNNAFVYTPTIAAPTTTTTSATTTTRPTTTTTTSTTPAPTFFSSPIKPQQYPVANGDDEDDGQYHPELYEQDFYRNRFGRPQTQSKSQSNTNGNNYNTQTTTSKTTQSNYNNFNGNNYNARTQTSSSPAQFYDNNNNDDELLQTAHSQNIAASGNELRAAAAAEIAKNSKTTKTSPIKQISRAPTISPTATSTRKPIIDDKDASYDYAYYDSSSNDNPHEYSEYSIIDFGKTKNSKKH